MRRERGAERERAVEVGRAPPSARSFYLLGAGPVASLFADVSAEGSVSASAACLRGRPLVEVSSLDDPCVPRAGHTAETPDGTVRVARLPGGVEIGFIEVTRRDALEGAYSDPGNQHAVREKR